MLKCSWLWSLLPNGSCITTLSTNSFCDDSTISNILASLVGSNTCWVKKLSCTRHKNVWSCTPVLCSVCYLIFPWLKSPIIIQSPLLTPLIALCIFSLFCLVMLGQRYTTPMVTVVCPVTNLHHMASLQSASSCNCTSLGVRSLAVARRSRHSETEWTVTDYSRIGAYRTWTSGKDFPSELCAQNGGDASPVKWLLSNRLML